MTGKIELANLIPIKQLTSFLKNLSDALPTCCAIVRYPTPQEKESMEKYKMFLTDTIPQKDEMLQMSEELSSLNQESCNIVFGQSDFCKLLRKSRLADLRCIYCDGQNSAIAYKDKNARLYPCHIGLFDMVAPIVVGDLHIADLFIGQNYRSIDIEELKQIYAEFELNKQSVSFDDFKAAYDRLQPAAGKEAIKSKLLAYKSLLFDLSHILSMYATSAAIGLIIPKIWHQTHLQTDPLLLLQDFFAAIKEIVHFDSCSFWVKDPKSETTLKCLYANWVSPNELKNLSISVDAGLAGKVMKTGSTLTLSEHSVIDKIPAMFPDLRSKRNLGSFIGVPFRKDNEVFGFAEVGYIKDFAFWPEAVPIVEEMTRYMGLFITLKSDFGSFFAKFVASSDPRYFLSMMIRLVLDMVQGIACSVMRINKSTSTVYCEATTGIEGVALGKEDSVVYALNQPSLTSWVINNNRSLNLESRNKLPDFLKEYGVSEPRSRETVRLPSGEVLSHDQYWQLPLLIVPFGDAKNAAGALRILGKITGDKFTLEDELLACNLANSLQYASTNPLSLLNIMTIGMEMLNNPDRQSIAYTLLTLITHGQGIGINRAMLFFYDAVAGIIEPILATGPANTRETPNYADIPTLSGCLGNAQINIEKLMISNLFQSINERIRLEKDCALLKILNEYQQIHICRSPNPLTKKLDAILSKIECDERLFLSIPAPESGNRYILICNNILLPSITKGQESLLLTLGSLFERALLNIDRIIRSEDLRKQGWLRAASTAAHNLGNKLPVACAAISEALQNEKNKDQQEILEISLNRIKSAISDVLALRQFDVPINPDTEVTMHYIMNRIQHYFIFACKAARIEQKWFNDAPGDPILHIDENRILDIIDIIVQNVYDLGLPKPSIVVRCACLLRSNMKKISDFAMHFDKYLCFSFTDNGTGVRDENKRRIFEPSYTSKNEGWGIGLAFATKIMEAHQGFITEEGEVGSGAQFRIYLPIVSEIPIHIQQPVENPQNKFTSKITIVKSSMRPSLPRDPNSLEKVKGRKILIVEDDDFVAERIIHRFQSPPENKESFACVVARGEEEYISCQKRWIYDVVIVDRKLWSGKRETDELGGIRVSQSSTIWNCNAVTILFSASLRIDYCVNAMREGAWDCIDKNDPSCFDKLFESALKGISAKFGGPLWLQENYSNLVKNYPGQYVAIINGMVVGNNPDIKTLREKTMKAKIGTKIKPVYFHVPLEVRQ